MTCEGDNVEPALLRLPDCPEQGHGHFFAKKSFGKPTCCHHCCEYIIWPLSQGYACEVCNFTCHEKCLSTVASYCSGVAMQLIKNPVAHTWSDPGPVKRRFCNVCRKRTDDQQTLECEVCEYYVHENCQELAVSDCKEAATFASSLEPAIQVQHHHFREGNLPTGAKCAVCKKSCYSSEILAGMRCEWCGITAHAICYKQLAQECNFGCLREIILPPNCLTIPRTELPMEQLLGLAPKKNQLPTPNRAASDENSSTGGGSDESVKDRDDVEHVRLFDGNHSLQNKTFKNLTVPRSITLQQLKEMALRAYHIHEDSNNYMLTQVAADDSEERLTEDQPLTQRRAGGRLQLILRYVEPRSEVSVIKVYGGWLRIPVTFCQVRLTDSTSVEDAISEALTAFRLNSSSSHLYNLVEVSLDRGVVERTFENNENLLRIIQEMRQGSLRKFQCSRFYLQEKEDPHGTKVALFVGNLSPNKSQKEYETLLLRHLGAHDRNFDIGPIYYEYGSLVITFESPKEATRAIRKLQSSAPSYENKPLLVLCLPHIQAHMVPSEVKPLMVLVNVKSGGCQGVELIRSFRKLLNPFQVFDVLTGGPLIALYVFRNIKNYKILICGGDGTVGWVLQSLDIVGQDSACHSPPCGVLPLGTGNDLARVLRWGSGWKGEDETMQILRDVIEAEEVNLDRWTIVFHYEGGEHPSDPTTSSGPTSGLEDQTSMVIMNNYFGIGVDADICLQFHTEREKRPEKFSNRWTNKMTYGKIGMKKVFSSACKDLHRKMTLIVDSRPIALPMLEGIIILNIMSWGSGANPWGKEHESEDGQFTRPTHHDGLLEVVGVQGVVHLANIQGRIQNGIRIAQGSSIRISTTETLPIQVDGEPRLHQAGEITIIKSFLKATMLRKSKIKRRPTESAMRQPCPLTQTGSTASTSGQGTSAMTSPLANPMEGDDFL